MSTILGTGLAGLVWAAYHPDSLLIGPQQLGGSVNENLGPMMIHSTPEVKRLWQTIGLEPNTRIAKVGYMRGFGTEISSEPDRFFREDYFKHSRDTTDKPPYSSMNSGSSSFECMDTSMDDLIEALANYVVDNGTNIVDAKIMGINVADKVNRTVIGLKENVSIMTATNDIVSTLPAKVFRMLGQRSHDIVLGDAVTKVFATIRIDRIKAFEGFDFVYCLPNDLELCVPRHFPSRITVTDRDKSLVTLEYNLSSHVSFDDSNIMESVMGLRGYRSSKVMRDFGIRHSKPVSVFKDIILLGRNAQWDHSVKINDVIERASKSVKE